jgi:hypothetical protein
MVDGKGKGEKGFKVKGTRFKVYFEGRSTLRDGWPLLIIGANAPFFLTLYLVPLALHLEPL